MLYVVYNSNKGLNICIASALVDCSQSSAVQLLILHSTKLALSTAPVGDHEEPDFGDRGEVAVEACPVLWCGSV